jgi:ATP-binding cassette, subfamily C, bacteriocin exporter
MLMAEVKEGDKQWIKETLVSANNKNDYGLAVLLSVLQFHKCDSTMEKLRILSGTNEAGCNLFGLQRAAIESGFACKGYKMDAETIKQCTFPAILSIFTKAQQQDYVVFYGTVVKKKELLFVIGHPADGLTYLSQRQLESLWASKFCLILEPGQPIAKQNASGERQKSSLLNLIFSQRTLFVSILILALLQGATVVFPSSWAINQFYEKWSEQQSILLLLYATIALLVFLLAKHGLMRLQHRFSLLLATPTVSTINEKFAMLFSRLPKLFLNSYRVERHLQYQKRIEKIEDSINLLLVKGLCNVAIALLALGMLLIHSYQLALLSLAFIVTFFLWLNRIKHKLLRLERSVDEVHSNTDIYIVESCRVLIAGFEMDKSKNFSRRVKQSNYNLYATNFNNNASIQDFDSKAILYCSLFAVTAIALCIGLFLAQEVSEKRVTITIFLVVLLTSAVHSLVKVPMAISSVNAVLQDIDKLEDLANVNLTKEPMPTIIDSLAVEELVYTTPDYNKSIVNKVNFTANRGNVTAIIGPNGSGKSIIAEILAQQYPFTSGSIIINGTTRLEQIDLKGWSGLVAMVRQEPYIFPGTVMENIMLGDGQDDVRKFYRFIQQYRLEAFLQIFPKREQTPIGDGYLTISLSQKQMITLIRGIYCNPQLLILDDILHQLDNNVKELAFFMLNAIKEHSCIVLFASDIASIEKYCDKKFFI